MSVTAKLYIALVIALGSAALVNGLFPWTSHDAIRFGCYLLLAIPASCLKVQLPGVTGTMSVLFLFLLAGVVELGLTETLVIGATCVLVQSFWRPKVRPRAVQVVFSVANIAIAITAAYYSYHWKVLSAPSIQSPFRLAIAASVFFLVNTYPVAIVIALTEKKSIRQVWSRCYCWSFPYYLVGAAIVGMFAFANRMLDWQAWLLILPVVYIIYRSYWLYLDQLQAERRQAEDERKHAEEVAALHEQTVEALASAMRANAKLDAVIQSSPLAIVALSREGMITSWNTMAECIFGWSPEEAIGRFAPFATGRSERIVIDIVARTLRGELVSGIETTQWRKDGTPFEATIWTAPLGNRAEGISGVLITVADVSDRKRLEEQLRLSHKMEAVGRLAGGVAHDFNNLLTVINGYSSMLMDSVKKDSYAYRQAEEILGAGTKAAELVSQLLAFSRRQVIKPKPLEVNQFVRDIERMLERIIGEHIEFRTHLHPDSGWIHADLNQMEAALLNLATNARDAMPEGGTLSIETAPVEIAEGANHHDLAPGPYVRIIVRDTGQGMDFATQQHLFEPFYTTKVVGKGTGLGLSSVYGTVQQIRGRIFVASELGKGTAFSIYLPRLQRPVLVEAPASRPEPASAGTETILLVEDENAVRRMLREALGRAGYRVWEAPNGAEAIRQWGDYIDEVDLLVTDIVMPVMNGLKLAEELHVLRPELRVVYMSGHSEDLINQQGGAEPAPDLLQKPFIPEVLVRKVREVVDEPSQRERARSFAAGRTT